MDDGILLTAAEDRDRFARSVDLLTGRPPEGPPLEDDRIVTQLDNIDT